MMSPSQRFAAVCLLLMSLVGCGGGNNSAGPVTATTTGQYQTLQFSASTRAAYFQGESVTVTFTVKNTGTQPVKYSTGGCYAGSRLSVWQNGQQLPSDTPESCFECSNALVIAEFAPGQTYTSTLTWDQKLANGCGARQAISPGRYQIQPYLNVALDGQTVPAQSLGPPLTISIR